MAEQIPVTPELLSWARQRAGYSLGDLQQKFVKYQDWEQGNSYPTYLQLEKLAALFKVPVAVFFFPDPPSLPPISKTFRTLPESEIENLPTRMRLLLRKAKAMQLNLHELTGGKNPAAGLITRDLQFSPTAAVESIATSVRDYIGIPVETQKSWSDIESALSEWRSALQRAGVFVFKDAFKEQNYSGFCLYDEEFPIIYVNNSSTKTRQIFTYFHELAHLLFHTSGIDQLHDEFIDKLTPDNKKIEILCNRFASEFLVPGSIINDTIQKYDASASTAELLANEFHVSREVIFRRFLDLNKITNSQYKAAVEEWNQQRTKGTGKGGDYYWTKLAYLGRGYVSLAISQFQQNRIDENKLADFLDTKPKNLEKLLEEQGWTF